jgi:hypothetical protein
MNRRKMTLAADARVILSTNTKDSDDRTDNAKKIDNAEH